MFVCKDLPATVYDRAGNLFYQTPRGSKGVFSLPAGDWVIDKPVKQTIFRRKIPKLPRHERNIPRPKKWNLLIAYNPAKCTINLERGRLLFDADLWKSLDRTAKTFILLHEFGHYFYKTEHFCDLYAKSKMLELGYNRSQVAAIDFFILSNTPASFARKKYTFDKIKNL